MSQPAMPKYTVGQLVHYLDRNNRPQSGAVQSIKATWHSGQNPYLVYRLSHPSYRNKRFYTGEESIAGVAL